MLHPDFQKKKGFPKSVCSILISRNINRCFSGKKGVKWIFSQFNLRNYTINFKQISLLQDFRWLRLPTCDCEYTSGWHNMQPFLKSLGWRSPLGKSSLRRLFHSFNQKLLNTYYVHTWEVPGIQWYTGHTQSLNLRGIYNLVEKTYMKCICENWWM